jgi:hypothetical protein
MVNVKGGAHRTLLSWGAICLNPCPDGPIPLAPVTPRRAPGACDNVDGPPVGRLDNRGKEHTVAIERFPVEAGHILLFARAIGDPNPAYYGALRGDQPVPAPPTFVQASAQFDPDYHLRPKLGAPWFGSGREATGASGARSQGGTSLHAEQHYVYHRPPRAGDVLTAVLKPGATWEKEGRRGGKLVFTETITEYRDTTGELVVTARAVGVRTEKVVEKESVQEDESVQGEEPVQ